MHHSQLRRNQAAILYCETERPISIRGASTQLTIFKKMTSILYPRRSFLIRGRFTGRPGLLLLHGGNHKSFHVLDWDCNADGVSHIVQVRQLFQFCHTLVQLRIAVSKALGEVIRYKTLLVEPQATCRTTHGNSNASIVCPWFGTAVWLSSITSTGIPCCRCRRHCLVGTRSSNCQSTEFANDACVTTQGRSCHCRTHEIVGISRGGSRRLLGSSSSSSSSSNSSRPFPRSSSRYPWRRDRWWRTLRSSRSSIGDGLAVDQ